tara:strand:+ start:688 stop:915 length:228 start_codon:yes stop_codon:yes gene_type:complete
MALPINNINYDEEQKIRTKNLELTRALQDVDRLTTEAVQYKLEIIELKEKNKALEQDYEKLYVEMEKMMKDNEVK